MRTYNVTSRCVHATIFAEEKRSVLQILSVCVALSIQHAMRMRHIVIYDLPPLYGISAHFLINGTNFERKKILLNTKRVF